MNFGRSVISSAAVCILMVTSGCGNAPRVDPSEAPTSQDRFSEDGDAGSTLWDLFSPNDTGTNLKVNKYIWNAALDVLDFMPVQSVDPFSGVIVMGFGTPPGGGRAYRATVYVSDPALEARSLRLAMQTRGGPVSASTVQAVEDAILARARQLRIADGRI